MINHVNEQYLHSELSEKIIKAFYHVYNSLGYGFSEKVYENALLLTLRKMGLSVVKQQNIKVWFEGEEVGDFYSDIIVEGKIILELKSGEGLREEHEAQLLNYLRATPMEVGLLMNFGKIPQFKRKVFSNEKKKNLIQKSF